MLAYKFKINSRKHLYINKRNNNDGYNIWSAHLIDTERIKDYIDSGFTLFYQRKKYSIVYIRYAMSFEVIETICNFHNNSDDFE